MAHNIQVGDVVEWDLSMSHMDGHTQHRIDKFGPGPFVILDIDKNEPNPCVYVTKDGLNRVRGYEDGIYAWRFKVNHFLTAVRKAKLNAKSAQV